LLIVDEVHQAKAKGTGVAWILQVLSQACKFTLGASGTLFGGYSTSVIMLWYRLIRDVRKEFSFKDEEAWVRQFGLLRQVFYLSGNAETQEDGAFTGTKFHETVSEQPGVSPAIMRFGLPFCTFISLKDIGLPLL